LFDWFDASHLGSHAALDGRRLVIGKSSTFRPYTHNPLWHVRHANVLAPPSPHLPCRTWARTGMAISSVEWMPMDTHFVPNVADDDNKEWI
jgi:hypothetical protein